MAITLAEISEGMADKVNQEVIDEFRRSSLLLDMLTFDDAVSPGTGGSTLTYGYMQLQTSAIANFRTINSEYETNEAKRTKKTVDLKIFGGAAAVDRVVNQARASGEIQWQLEQQITAAKNLFHYTAINGDKSGGTSFDGLTALLKGKSTEYNAGSSDAALDISDTSKLDTNYKKANDMLLEFLSGFDGKPTMFLANSLTIARLKSIAHRLGYLTKSEDSFGRAVTGFDGIMFMDVGSYYDSGAKKSLPCIPISEDGTTDLYAVTLGLDAFHGVSIAGDNPINTYLPDLTQPGAVKKAEVEMVAAVALKNTLKAGVFRNIQVR